jgi:hypothetical protein
MPEIITNRRKPTQDTRTVFPFDANNEVAVWATAAAAMREELPLLLRMGSFLCIFVMMSTILTDNVNANVDSTLLATESTKAGCCGVPEVILFGVQIMQ